MPSRQVSEQQSHLLQSQRNRRPNRYHRFCREGSRRASLVEVLAARQQTRKMEMRMHLTIRSPPPLEKHAEGAAETTAREVLGGTPILSHNHSSRRVSQCSHSKRLKRLRARQRVRKALPRPNLSPRGDRRRLVSLFWLQDPSPCRTESRSFVPSTHKPPWHSCCFSSRCNAGAAHPSCFISRFPCSSHIRSNSSCSNNCTQCSFSTLRRQWRQCPSFLGSARSVQGTAPVSGSVCCSGSKFHLFHANDVASSKQHAKSDSVWRKRDEDLALERPHPLTPAKLMQSTTARLL
mmetsp:Transcript_61896/g.145028  ORF Transcript_61896/g.145028 Transcript_61896/m.145028 type:complete len:292 (+) Transcript_61896:958-1833(+)